MIFVFQDESKIPVEWLDKVAVLQSQLESISDSQSRILFIQRNSSVWGEIKEQLLEMSGGKCWYSEAPDAVSDWHVDHFRPKGKALDADRTEHEGYHWLAFDWRNYRIAGSYSNSPHRDKSGQVRGKWDYFPLAQGCVRASWSTRNCSEEICLLLDPTIREDPKLITFDEQGIPMPSDPCNPIVRKRVETTVHFLNLDQQRLVEARKKKWRETLYLIEEYRQACPMDFDACTHQDHHRVHRMLEKLGDLTGPTSRYASTARACLIANSMAWAVVAPEEAIAA